MSNQQRKRRTTMDHVAPHTITSAPMREIPRGYSTGGITKETQEGTMSKLRRAIFNQKRIPCKDDFLSSEQQAIMISGFVKGHLKEIANDSSKFRRFQKSLRKNRTTPTTYLNSILSESYSTAAKVHQDGRL